MNMKKKKGGGKSCRQQSICLWRPDSTAKKGIETSITLCSAKKSEICPSLVSLRLGHNPAHLKVTPEAANEGWQMRGQIMGQMMGQRRGPGGGPRAASISKITSMILISVHID